MDALRSAVEALYSTFERYPLRDTISGCDDCISKADEHQLRSKPLRKLRSEDLNHYVWHAIHHWGDFQDFKHFLPRLFELEVFEQVPWNPEILFERLRQAEWLKWPEREKSVIRELFDRLWSDQLTERKTQLDIGTFLCCLGCATDDIEPYLKQWLTKAEPSAWKSLEEFLSENVNSVQTKGKLQNSFWVPEPAKKVMAWLKSAETRKGLETMLSQQSSPNESLFNAWQWLDDAFGRLDKA